MTHLRTLIAAGIVALAAVAAPAAAAGPLAGRAPDALTPPPRRAAQDSADAVYTTAREAFTRGDYKRAAELFDRVATRWPKSDRRGDALYWRAYALYRAGGTSDLREARSTLATLRTADRETFRRDGSALDTRICGELARRGDARCAATVEQRADSADLSGVVGDIVRAVSMAAGDVARMAGDAASNALRDPTIQQSLVQAGAAAQDVLREGARATREALRGTTEGLREQERALREMQRDAQRDLSYRSSRRSADDCEDDDDDERIIALNALLQMDAERAVPMLKKVMARRDTCAEVLRRKAVFLIAQKRSPDAADILIDAARNDPDGEVREQAVFWLSRVDGARASEFLRDLVLRAGGDVEMRKKAVFALSQMSGTGGRETLRQIAGSREVDAEVRGEAIFWLGQRGSAEDVDFLRTLYPRLESRELKDKVLFAASRRRGNAGWLLDVAQDPKESIELRKQALFWAGQGGAPVEQLVSLYDRTSDAEMKKQLVFVYQQRGGSGPAFEKLLDIARNERDKEIRSSAVFWLTRSKDPRALKLLEDIINK